MIFFYAINITPIPIPIFKEITIYHEIIANVRMLTLVSHWVECCPKTSQEHAKYCKEIWETMNYSQNVKTCCWAHILLIV